MASILRPKALRAGDLIAVAALSGGLDESEAAQLARGVEAIEQMGLCADAVAAGGRGLRILSIVEA